MNDTTTDTAASRVADFLAAHAAADRSDEVAIRDWRTATGYGVSVLRAHDVADVLAELDSLRAQVQA